MVKFETYFGIPASTLRFLASLPVLFLVFDLFALTAEANHHSRNLKIIAIANWCYILLSLILAYLHIDTVTFLGWLYIILEVVIICIISYIEWSRSIAKLP
jgi:hypothetical protein